MSDNENCSVRCKNMMYEQQLKHLPTGTIDNPIGQVEKTNLKKYALIIHAESHS